MQVLYLLNHFNTSHVNVNLYRKRLWRCWLLISIHLMLMLILDLIFLKSPFFYFNTSHVNVNHQAARFPSLSNIISIHLMLMLIFTATDNKSPAVFISIHLMLMLIAGAGGLDITETVFQYISC